MTRKRLLIAAPLALVALLGLFALIGAVTDSRHGAASQATTSTGGAPMAAAPASRDALGESGAVKAPDASGQAAGDNGSGYHFNFLDDMRAWGPADFKVAGGAEWAQ